MTEEKETGNSLILTMTTIIMGLIAIATAWSGFQATKWGGQMANSYAAANAARTRSLEASLTANQQAAIDVQVFLNWVNALAAGNEELSEFYYERMRDEAKPAIEAWLATIPLENPNAPPNPFVMEEYVLAKAVEASEKESEAVALREKALDANQTGDNYVLTTVILATALFFAGIATRLRSVRIEFVFMLIAMAALVFGIYIIASYPIIM